MSEVPLFCTEQYVREKYVAKVLVGLATDTTVY